ncbi:MAG: ankyrin repeat domain-containing protein [Thermoanaerobaculia bacterium]
MLSLALAWTAPAAPDPRPFLLGGIQLNEADHQRWSAALIQSGMNAVEVTVYATQGPWNRPHLWYSDAEPAVLAEIRAARKNGLQVVLILRLALDHSDPANRFLWHGLIFPETEAELAAWFRRYTDFVCKWARVAAAEGIEVLGIASELSSLEATLPVDEIPELADYYLDDAKQAELRALVDRHLDLFDGAERVAMGAGDFASLDDFLVERNQAERRWAQVFTFAGSDADSGHRIASINRHRQRLQRHWTELIAEVRAVYPGRLTLASNFDNYHQVGFWNLLDFIGINAYFPLRASLDSPLDEAAFAHSWRQVFADVDAFKKARGLRHEVIFTELGYTRRRGVTFAPWSSNGFVPIFAPGDDREDSILLWSAQPDDPEERALAVRSLFAAWKEDRWPLAGILYWKLSSRLDLARYEPFMLYLGPEAGDPLFDAMTLFADHVRPLDDPFAAGKERYRRWYDAIVRDDRAALAALAGRPRARAPVGTLPPLHLAVQLSRGAIVRDLVRRGARVRGRDRSGLLPLHWSCYQQDPELVSLLLPPARTSWRDDGGETPMMKCARLDNAAVMGELLRHRPELLEERNERSQTALWLAADQASAETIELLVNHGAAADLGDGDGVTPLHVAARRGDPAIVEILAAAPGGGVRDHGGNRPVDYAAYFGKVKSFHLLWKPENGGELNKSGQSLLHHAAHGGNVAILRTLLQAGLDVQQADRDGKTPLHFAALKAQRDAAPLLLQQGAEAAVADAQGTTALHLAAADGDPRLLPIFLAQAPDLEIADGDGNTPLHHAAGWGRIDNVRLLLAAGAPVDLRNHQGQTAFEVAEESGRKRVMELLKRP